MNERQLRVVAIVAGAVATVIVAVVFWQITFRSDSPEVTAATPTRAAPALPTRASTEPTPTAMPVTDGVSVGDTSGDEIARQQVQQAADAVMAYRNVATADDVKKARRVLAKTATEAFVDQARDTWASAPWAQQEPGTTTTSELVTAQVLDDIVRVLIEVTTTTPDGVVIVGEETWDVRVSGDGLISEVVLA